MECVVWVEVLDNEKPVFNDICDNLKGLYANDTETEFNQCVTPKQTITDSGIAATDNDKVNPTIT